MALRIRRGTDLERIGVVFVEGELVYSTDTKRLYIGDGVTAGGVSVSDLINDTSPQLGADIDLNGQDIVGFGNINIDGDISATGTLTIPTIITDVTGSIFGDDSQPLVDGANSKIVLDNNVLNDISDISITNPASGEFLSWNGASWINSSNFGDVTANVTGNHIGSVYKDANTIVLNVNNGKLFGDVVGSVTGFLIGDVTGNVTGDVTGNVTGDVTGDVAGDVIGNLVGSVYSNDGSTVLVNGDLSILYGDVTGNVTGDVTGNVTGDVTGDIFGSVYAPDGSTVLVNGDTSTFYGGFIGDVTGDVTGNVTGDVTANTIQVDLIKGNPNPVIFDDDIGFTLTKIEKEVATDSISLRANLSLSRTSTTLDLTNSYNPHGSILFEVDDLAGQRYTAQILGGNNNLTFVASTNGSWDVERSVYLVDTDPANASLSGYLGLGTYAPEEKIHVKGNAKVEGFVQFGSYADATARDAAITSPAAGMVIFLADDGSSGGVPAVPKFQGYDGSAWINLS